MPDRFIPRLADFWLDIITTRDTFDSALSIHEFPFSNINDIEHHGMKPRRVAVECVFQSNPPITPGWSVDESIVQPTYNHHFAFLDMIENVRESLTFAHPKYGEMDGKVQNLTVVNDDTDEFAAISFEFIREVKTEKITFVRYIVPELASGWTGTNTKATEVIETAEKDTTNATTWAASVQSNISTLDSYLSEITSPATSIINTINYGTSVPGLFMESINGAVDRVVELYQTARNAPASFINNLIVGMRLLKSTVSGVNANYVHVMGASRVAYEAGVIYDEDDQNFRQVETNEATPTWDIAGNYKGKAALPVIMTQTELEDSLYQVRQFINEAIQLDRDNRDLQEQARKLQEHVNQIKLGRARIETKAYPRQTMHEIAIKAGLAYDAAERLLSLNPTIINPNFTEGDIQVLTPTS